jgi:hypothetical protein
MLRESLYTALGNTSSGALKNIIGCDPFNKSHNDNGSSRWLSNSINVFSNTSITSEERDALMDRFVRTNCYTFMKYQMTLKYNCEYNVNLGPSLIIKIRNEEVPAICFANKKGDTHVFTPEEISAMNTNNGFSAPVASYMIDTMSAAEDMDKPYFINDEHERTNRVCTGRKRNGEWTYTEGPLYHRKATTDYDNPIIASKFMNGGMSNNDILFSSCTSNGMTDKEANQHIQSIVEINGSISTVTTDEELETVRTFILEDYASDPIPNRTSVKNIAFSPSEMLHYVIQQVENERVKTSLLTAKNVLDNHGTAALIPALQKMYKTCDTDVSHVTMVKKSEDITHPDVVAFIDTTSKVILEKLNHALNIDTVIEITDEMIEDLDDNCPDALIKQFIGDSMSNLTEIKKQEAPSTVADNSSSESSTDDDCQICHLPGAIPINIDDNDDYCKHPFHPQCLAKWALSINCTNHDCCPTCRKSFR